MFNNEMKNQAFILAFITAGLFTYGLTYHQGYLGYWGLEETMFNLSLERTLFQGFVAANHLGAKTLGPLIIVSVLCFAVVFLFGCLWDRLKTKEYFYKIKLPEVKKYTETISLKYVGLFVAFSYWAFVALITLIFLLLVADFLGKEAASDQFKRFSKNQNPPLVINHKKYGVLAAHSILCSNSHCAFLVKGIVKTYSLADIHYFESRPSNEK